MKEEQVHKLFPFSLYPLPLAELLQLFRRSKSQKAFILNPKLGYNWACCWSYLAGMLCLDSEVLLTSNSAGWSRLEWQTSQNNSLLLQGFVVDSAMQCKYFYLFELNRKISKMFNQYLSFPPVESALFIVHILSFIQGEISGYLLAFSSGLPKKTKF